MTASQAGCTVPRRKNVSKLTRVVRDEKPSRNIELINLLLHSGPCKSNEIFRLQNSSSVPDCFENPCASGLVEFQGKCVQLDSEAPCEKFTAFVGRKVYLVYKPSTAELICESEDLKYECANNCCRGHKREYRDICPGQQRKSQQQN